MTEAGKTVAPNMSERILNITVKGVEITARGYSIHDIKQLMDYLLVAEGTSLGLHDNREPGSVLPVPITKLSARQGESDAVAGA